MSSLPADVRWGFVVVTHSFLPHGPWGRNECVTTTEPQRTSAGRLRYEQRFLSYMAFNFSVHEVVRVACQSRSWFVLYALANKPATRQTSHAAERLGKR